MTDATLLAYAFLTAPDPLQAAKDATLTLVVSNGGSQAVDLASIAVTFLVGSSARDLVAPGEAGKIATQVPVGWGHSEDGGSFTLTPSAGPSSIGAHGVSFVFATVPVNPEVGITEVTIDEDASSASQPSAKRTVELPLAKFPSRFEVSKLVADPLEVDSGGTANLMWTGSPASYRLEYDPGSGHVDREVGSSGPYPAAGLTTFPSVAFTLVVKVPIPGDDKSLVLQRSALVTVRVAPPTITEFAAVPTEDGSELRLTWAMSGADRAQLTGQPYALHPVGGQIAVPQPFLDGYELTAANAGGRTASMVDLDWGAVANTVATAAPTTNVAVTPDGTRLLVVSEDAVLVLDAVTLEEAATPIQVGDYGVCIGAAPDGRYAWVVIGNDRDVVAIDLRTLAVGRPLAVGGHAQGVVMPPDGTHALVSQNEASSVAVIDAQATQVLGTIAVGAGPLGIAASPDGKRVYVCNSSDGTVSAIDVSTLKVVGEPIPVGRTPVAIAVSPDGTRAFVGCSDGQTLSAIDTVNLAPAGQAAELPGAAAAVALSGDGSRVFVAVAASDWDGPSWVVVLDAHDLAVVEKLGVTPNVSDLASSADNAFVAAVSYVSSTNTGSVTRIVRNVVSGGTGGPG